MGSCKGTLSRRGLLEGMAALSGLMLASGDLKAGTGTEVRTPAATKAKAGRQGPSAERLRRAYDTRLRAARQALDAGSEEQHSNSDEERLPARIASYTKGLPHDERGEVEPKSYEFLSAALRSGDPEDFERIPLGGFAKLANPQAAWTFGLLGPDAAQIACPPAPNFASAEQAGEMVELAWQAVLRDVPFAEYETSPVARSAAEELSRLSDFRGPRSEGKVKPATLFRGTTAGDLAGPYLSQFLLKPIPFTPVVIDQRIRTAAPGLDYLTSFQDWLSIQNGALSGVNRFDEKARYIRNGRDLGEYVHRDFSYQPYLSACLQALKWGTGQDGANPYIHSRTQSGFVTFGQPYLLGLVAAVTQSSLAACWYQKWRVHRRLRPEELGGRLDLQLRGEASYPLHADLLGSTAVAELRRRWGSALLPQAYPEGCPLHPAYPAGHAVIAGACVTALKACLDESHEVPQPVIASADGLALEPYKGPALTIGGELDKLASNVAIGRNFAGLHWRSDASEGLRLGEEVAIRVLREMSLTGNEVFAGFSLRRFDGSRLTVT